VAPYFTPQRGDIPAKRWRIYPRAKPVAFCCRDKVLFFNDTFYIETAGLSDFHAVILKRELQRRNMLRIFSNRPLEIVSSGKAMP
jgi:hypothetical protein